MTQAGIVIALAASFVQAPASRNEVAVELAGQKASGPPAPLRDAFAVQFTQSLTGRTVRVMLDGRTVKTTSAGKLFFRDARGAGVSVCADVRAPIARGMTFGVVPYRSSTVGGGIAKAGNIVAKWFRSAQSADACAGLQLAVWEAIEDGGARPDFAGGWFRAEAGPVAIAHALQYYAAIEEPGDALFLQAGQGGPGGSGGGQSQITTTL